MRIKTLFCGVIFTIFCFLFLYGCAEKSPDKGEVIATVNNEPIFVKDFKRTIELNVKRDPMFRITPQTLDQVINVLIDKKLLIQQAREKKLDQTKRFVNTIQTFWEQTLIRDLIISEDKELEGSVAVTGKEIRDQYENLSHQKTFQVIQSRDKTLIAELVKLDPKSIEWEETIGPVTYGDISSDLLREVFPLKKGEMKILKHENSYYLFYVSADSIVALEPLSKIKEKLKKSISSDKKRKLFKKWLAGVRSQAGVTINKDALKGVTYKNE